MSNRSGLNTRSRQKEPLIKTRARGKNIGANGVGAVGAAASAPGYATTAIIAFAVALATAAAFTGVTIWQSERVDALENAPPVEGGNQTALDLLQSQIDQQQMQIDQQQMDIEELQMQQMDTGSAIDAIWETIMSPGFVAPLDTVVVEYVGAPFDLQKQSFIGGINYGFNSALVQFPFVSQVQPEFNITHPQLIAQTIILNQASGDQSVSLPGLFLANGTWAVRFDLSYIRDYTNNHQGFLSFLPIDTLFTSTDPLQMDWMGDLQNSQDFVDNYGTSPGDGGWTFLNGASATVPTSTTAIGTIVSTGSGGHLHIFTRYVNSAGAQTAEIHSYKLTLCKIL